MLIHTVKQGNTLESIAKMHDVPLFVLNALNSPPAPELVVGQTIVVRRPLRLYTVQAGEILSDIAVKTSTDIYLLMRNNPQIVGRELYSGESLVIRYDDEKQTGRAVLINAYAYPYTDRSLIIKALPYLTMLTIFTYGFSEDGELISPDDDELIALAYSYGVKPVMLLSTLTSDGSFSNELADVLLNSEYLQDILIQKIIANMQSKGYYALDIDFEYVPQRDKEAYAAFVKRLTEQLNKAGFLSLVALAPKTSSSQSGLLYEAHDYFALGRAANLALTMTYEWGYTYGPPMAVAPINKVNEVLSYAVTEIPPQKLLMGIPLYGYDWKIPYEKGVSKATSISPQQAIVIAYENGAEILYNEASQAPYFRYGGDTHEVWFEDAKSIQAKLALLDRYSLAGIGYWNLARDFPQNWAVLNALHNILKL
jgi:spore germination protein